MLKVVILAGGLGTRFPEETELRPKPMITIGRHPILWHILKGFEYFGFNEFYIAVGYKGDVIKNYFTHYHMLNGNIAVDLSTGNVTNDTVPVEQWKVHIIETGERTETGGRIRQMKHYLEGDEPFIVTYGDGVADIDIPALITFHKSHGKTATVTAVRPPARFGAINFDGNKIRSFSEKPHTGEGWINGGFMVFNQRIFDYLKSDYDSLERNALEHLAADNQLEAFPHHGFWQCMDTPRDKRYLEDLWQHNPPWKVW
ncbi:MAG: glucose-1-phosphate cytidylyltransferase [Planctomycetaceae bacterium]|nr:glucose-1-phosphate cytidylyltransferase [Planctomycetaceae bacterium]